MTTKLTAAEARNLAGVADDDYVDECIDRLLVTIKEIASDKKREVGQKRSCATGYQHKHDIQLWVNGGYDNTPNWLAAKAKLEGLGFKVKFYYAESQFVDMYTLVEW